MLKLIHETKLKCKCRSRKIPKIILVFIYSNSKNEIYFQQCYSNHNLSMTEVFVQTNAIDKIM